jgi:hypothetical protein
MKSIRKLLLINRPVHLEYYSATSQNPNMI